MRKPAYFLLLGALIFSNFAFAQQSFEFGARVIPQTTWLYSSDDDELPDYNYNTTWRTSFGISVGFNLEENFGFQVGAYYSPQGQKHKGDDVDNQVLHQPSDVELTYWKLPVLLKFSADPSARAFIVFYMGPEFTFLTKARHHYTTPAAEQIAEAELKALGFDSYRDVYKRTFVSFVLGFGPNFSITDFLKINASFKFSIALTDSENKDATGVGGIKYWDAFPGGDNREGTLNMTGGFNLGITYVLDL